MSTRVLQDSKKPTEKFIKIKENGKLCDAKISRQHPGENGIIGDCKKPLKSHPGCQTEQCREAIQDLGQ